MEARTARILVVDDEPMNRKLLESLLALDGHSIVHAADGTKALDVIRQGHIDLVLLDVLMPGLDGYEVCRRIREDLGLVTLPVVFVTALGDRASRVLGKAAGADDFLLKPVDPLELAVRVQNLLRAKAYHDLKKHQQELVEKELEESRKHLVKSERLAMLGTLAGGVGHELNNAATVLMTSMGFVRDNAAQGKPPEAEDLDNLDRMIAHVVTHARQLLSLARPGPDHAERLDLRDVIEATARMLKLAGRTKRLDVQLVMPPVPVVVTINRTRIEQVLVNLISNAADAFADMPTGTRSTITISLRTVDGRAVCSVADNGCGIPADKLATIFEAYYTTKAPERGTGLGLPVARHIVESFGGTLSVDSTPGQGSTFHFDLPMATAAVDAGPASRPNGAAAAGSGG